MNEPDALEKQLRSWTPRRPSAKIAARLFGRTERGAGAARRSPSLGWLAPAFACALALMVAIHGAGRGGATLDEKDVPAYFPSGTPVSAAGGTQPFALSRMDLNVEWNIWPRVTSWQTVATVAEATRAIVAVPSRLEHFTLPFTNR